MSWTNFFTKILVINLKNREDRLLEIYEEMDRYDIPFELVTAIENENGAIGLRDTMVNIFERALVEKWENVLIIEDDCLFLENPNMYMPEAVSQLPQYWDLLFLGCQATAGFKYRHSANLLQLDMAFATHCVAYSAQAIRTIMTEGLEAPIDNSIVKIVEPMQRCFVTYPMLATQRESYSDIGKTIINWRPFLEQRYNQKLAEM